MNMKARRSSARSNRARNLKRNLFNYKYRGKTLATTTVIVAMLAVLVVGLKVATNVDSTIEVTVNDDVAVNSQSIVAVEDMVTAPSTETAAVTAVAAPEPVQESTFENKVVASTEGTLNIRSSADTGSELVGQMDKGAVGDIVAVEGEWTKIKSGDVEGYVKTEFVLSGEEAESFVQENADLVGVINDEGVRIRTDASTEAEVVNMIPKDTKVDVIETTDGWVKISLEGVEFTPAIAEDGTVVENSTEVTATEGYVSADFIEIEPELDYAKSAEDIKAEQEAAAAAAKAAKAAETAKKTTTTAKSNTSNKKTNTGSSTTVATTQTAATPADVSDAYLLACLVNAEANGDSYEGQLAVANVVLNRVRAGWGSISSVIYAKGQFSVVNSTMPNYLNNGPSAVSQQAANDAIAGTNNVGSCLYFKPSVPSTSNYTKIGAHYFY